MWPRGPKRRTMGGSGCMDGGRRVFAARDGGPGLHLCEGPIDALALLHLEALGAVDLAGGAVAGTQGAGLWKLAACPGSGPVTAVGAGRPGRRAGGGEGLARGAQAARPAVGAQAGGRRADRPGLGGRGERRSDGTGGDAGWLRRSRKRTWIGRSGPAMPRYNVRATGEGVRRGLLKVEQLPRPGAVKTPGSPARRQPASCAPFSSFLLWSAARPRARSAPRAGRDRASRPARTTRRVCGYGRTLVLRLLRHGGHACVLDPALDAALPAAGYLQVHTHTGR